MVGVLILGEKTKSLMRKTRLGSSGHQIRNKCFVYCALKVLDSVFPKFSPVAGFKEMVRKYVSGVPPSSSPLAPKFLVPHSFGGPGVLGIWADTYARFEV